MAWLLWVKKTEWKSLLFKVYLFILQHFIVRIGRLWLMVAVLCIVFELKLYSSLCVCLLWDILTNILVCFGLRQCKDDSRRTCFWVRPRLMPAGLSWVWNFMPIKKSSLYLVVLIVAVTLVVFPQLELHMNPECKFGLPTGGYFFSCFRCLHQIEVEAGGDCVNVAYTWLCLEKNKINSMFQSTTLSYSVLVSTFIFLHFLLP